MAKVVWLNRSALPALPHHALITDEATFRRELVRLGIKQYVAPLATPKADATVHHLDDKKDGDTTCVVYISKQTLLRKSLPQLMSLLVHEAVHIWQEYCENRLNEKRPCHELEAYAIQRISQNLITEALRIRKVK